MIDDNLKKSVQTRFFLGQNQEEQEVITKESMVKLSDGLTSIQNAFNQVKAYTGNVAKIQKAVAAARVDSKKEIAIEQRNVAPVDRSNDRIASLFPELTKALNELRDSFEKLDLSQTAGGQQGDMGGGGGGMGLLGTLATGAAVAGLGYMAFSGDEAEAATPEPEPQPEPQPQPQPAAPAASEVADKANERVAERRAESEQSDTRRVQKQVSQEQQTERLAETAERAAQRPTSVTRAAAPKATNSWSDNLSTFINRSVAAAEARSAAAAAMASQGGGGGGGGDFGSGGEYAAAGGGGQGEWASDAPFISSVNALSRSYNIDANDLLGLMQSESGINPQARNPSGATGLIQFMPATARGLGTTTNALYGMNRVQQMEWVGRYFQSVRLPRGATAGNLYTSVFLPKYTNRSPNFVIARRGGANDEGDNRSGSWYSQNSGLDLNRDGNITIAELGSRVSQKRQSIGLGPSRSVGGFAAATGGGGGGGGGAGGGTFRSGSASRVREFASGAVEGMSAGQGQQQLQSMGIAGGNGRLPESSLRRLTAPGATHHRAAPAAAAGMSALIVAAARQGIRIGVTDSYRSYAQQVELRRRKPGLAAKPGRSNHGWGLAFDLSDGGRALTTSSAAYRFLKANGPRFGIYGPLARANGSIYEIWHWEYRGGGSASPNTPTVPVTNTEQQVTAASPRLRTPAGGTINAAAAASPRGGECHCPEPTVVAVPGGGAPSPTDYLRGVRPAQATRRYNVDTSQDYRVYFNAA